MAGSVAAIAGLVDAGLVLMVSGPSLSWFVNLRVSHALLSLALGRKRNIVMSMWVLQQGVQRRDGFYSNGRFYITKQVQ